jgi:hypothetical protein
VYSVHLRHRTTGQELYIRLTHGNQTTSTVRDCYRAAHFRGPLAAAQVRDRAAQDYPDFTLSVTLCLCPTGSLYEAALRQT